MKLYSVLLGLIISALALAACDSNGNDAITPTRPDDPAVKMLPVKMSYTSYDMASSGPDQNVVIEYTYDDWNRLIKCTTRTQAVGENTEKLIVTDISYDDLGRIVSHKVGGTGYEIETDYREGLLSEYYTATFEYDGNMVTTVRPGTVLSITTDENGFAHRLRYEWDMENTDVTIHTEDYTYDKNGNIIRIEEHQNDYNPVHTYTYSNDIGVFRCVNMPQWYMMTYLRGYGDPIHIVNNAVNKYFGDNHWMDYSYIYNNAGYPVHIKGDIDPGIDGAQSWSVTVEYKDAAPSIE